MTDNVGFTIRGLKEYIEWQAYDKRTLKKINRLINDIVRNGHDGLGKPEQLKGDMSGYYVILKIRRGVSV